MLAVFYVFLIALWSFGIAFNGAPDESTHFYLLEYLYSNHTLPLATEPLQTLTGSISGHIWQKGEFWYHGLPFPHILGALITTDIGSWFLPSELLYLGARSFNWLLGGVFICALFRAARNVGAPVVISMLIAISVSIPQVTFVFSYLNSDGYGLMCIALLISALTAFINSPIRKRAMYLGLAIGVMLMAKLYFIPALVFAFVMLAATRIFNNKSVLAHWPTIVIAAVAVASPMLIIVFLKYGEISGISGQIDFVNMHKLNPAAGYGTCYFLCGDNLLNDRTLLPWLDLTLKSYFSVTGWMNIFISDLYYGIAALILFAVICASAFQIKPLNSQETPLSIAVDYALPILMIVALYPAITALSLIASQNSLPQPQGRYLFVTIPFLGLLLAMTAKRLIERRQA